MPESSIPVAPPQETLSDDPMHPLTNRAVSMMLPSTANENSRTRRKPEDSYLNETNDVLDLGQFASPRLPRGVIGNTADFGSAIQGSSPCGVI